MDISCFMQGCTESVIFACDCKDELTYICSSHSNVHLFENKGRQHSIFTCAKLVKNEDKSRFLSYFNEILWDAMTQKVHLLGLLQEINSEAGLIIANLNKICKKVEDIVKKITVEDIVTIFLAKNSFKEQNELTDMDIKFFRSVLTKYKTMEYKNFQFAQEKFFLIIRGQCLKKISIKLYMFLKIILTVS